MTGARPWTVFVDVDGVLSDFCRYALWAHGRTRGRESVPDFYADPSLWPVPGEREMLGWMLMEERQFWEPMLNVDFWFSMPPTPDALRVMAECVAFAGHKGNIHLLTSPHRHHLAWAGRLAWVERHWPDLLPRTILAGDCKHACAHPGAVLVDDSDANVERFRDAGGKAVLLPRAWNSRWREAAGEGAVVALRRDLRRIREG